MFRLLSHMYPHTHALSIFDFTSDKVITCLRMLWRLDLYAVDGALAIARCVRDFLVAQSATACRADVRARLSADLKLHATRAHKLTMPCAHSSLLACESLAKLDQQARSWQLTWQGGLTFKPSFPIFSLSLFCRCPVNFRH